MVIEKIKRAWTRLAPKLIAFLATGLTSSALIGLVASFGVVLSPELAAIIVGGLSSTAAYIQRDNLLTLPPGQFSLKVLAFVLTSASAVGVIAVAAQFGVDLSAHTVLIGFVITAAGAIVGYFQSDVVVVDAGSGKVGSSVSYFNG